MELFQINYVLAVAQYRNFTRAAAELCLTPPSLSQQIKKLEDELGVELFIRTTRSVKLTQAGTEFVDRAQKITKDISDIDGIMKKYVAGESGQLSIGCTPAMKSYGISHLISLFSKKYPNILLNFHEAECFDLYEPLYNGKIDLALLTAFDKAEPGKIKLDGYPLVDDEIVIVTCTDHPFASKKVINLKEASEESFILISRTSGVYRDTVDACHHAGFEPKFTYSTQYVDTCLGLVAEGAGIAALSSCLVTQTLWNNIAIVRIRPKIKRTLSLVIPHKKLSPALKNFKIFLIEAAKEFRRNNAVSK